MRLHGGSLDPLRERPFLLLFLRQALSGVGDAIVPVAITFAVSTSETPLIGIVLDSGGVAHVLFLLVGGVWSDRLPRQLVMMAADGVRAVAQALIAFALFFGTIAVWQLAVASAVFGAAEAFFNPASTALLPQIVSAGRLQEANALLSLSRSARVTGWDRVADSAILRCLERTLLQRIHNPHNRGCGCDTDCWCNRTMIGRAVKWWFPARWFGIHHKHTFIDGMTPDEGVEWKREHDPREDRLHEMVAWQRSHATSAS